jgi:adenosine kinase
VEKSGVNGYFCKDLLEVTGTCAVVVVEKERTLCANLAAACKYSIQHLNDNINVLQDSKLIYTSSFFITSNFEALVQVAEYATNNNIPLGFNLSAVFLI